MTIRQGLHHGNKRWRVDLGTRDGKRRVQFFQSERRAKSALSKAAKDAIAIGKRWADLPADQRLALLDAVQEIEQAGLTLRQVWDGYRNGTNGKQPVQQRTLRQAIHEIEQSKRAANRRAAYTKTLVGCLDAFARGRGECPVNRVTTADIEAWLTSRRYTDSSRASMLTRPSTLFVFCVRRGYCTVNPCDGIDRVSVEPRPPLILTPRQAAKVLVFVKRNSPRGLAWFALALLAGVRPEEADKLKWSDIDLERGIVTVDVAASKVRNRRIVHLMPAALTWLKTARQLGAETQVPHITRRRYLRAVRAKLGFEKWPTDLLRHTAASYLLAHHQDAGKVALELGNSPAVLFRHYRELVTRQQADRFWRLFPDRAQRRPAATADHGAAPARKTSAEQSGPRPQPAA